MYDVSTASRMRTIHSDIRGPVYIEANRMIAEGIPVLKLNTGNPGSFGFKMPTSVREVLTNNLENAVPYCDVKGMPEARRAICNYHVRRGFQNVTPEDIFIGNGVSEIASMIATALFEYGDEVLIPCPSYSLWTNVTIISGARPVFYRCDEESDWYPDVQDMRGKITSKTKAILLVNPNNPTGAVYPDDLQREIIKLAREHHLALLADEIYDRLVMDGLPHSSAAALDPEMPIVTFNGLSKSHVICGFRCGWMVVSGPEKFKRDVCETVHKLASMRLCGNALTQLVVHAALADEDSTRAMLGPGGRLYEQREATCAALDKIPGVSYVKNHAAFYLFPKIDTEKFNITDDQKFAYDVLHGAGVLLVPGSGFDWPRPDHFRIVMLAHAQIMTKAMEDIGRFLETYRQE